MISLSRGYSWLILVDGLAFAWINDLKMNVMGAIFIQNIQRRKKAKMLQNFNTDGVAAWDEGTKKI